MTTFQAFIPRQSARGFIVPNFIQKHTNLSIGAKYLFGVLCDYARDKDYCYPSKTTLAKIINCSLNSIRNWIKELIESGLIKITNNGKRDVFNLFCPVEERVEQTVKYTETIKNTEKNFSKECLNFEHNPSNFEYKANLKEIKQLTPSKTPTSSLSSHSQCNTSLQNGSVSSFNFNDFWNVYPRKENKERARIVFVKLVKNKAIPHLEAFCKAIGFFKDSPQWQRENGRFIPQLHNFIADKRWEEVEEQRAKNSLEKPVITVKEENYQVRQARYEQEALQRQENERKLKILQDKFECFSRYFALDSSFSKFKAQRYFYKHFDESNILFQIKNKQNITMYEYFAKNTAIEGG